MQTGTTQMQPLLNKQAALSRMGGDEEILKLLAQAFLEDIPAMMQDLQAAVNLKDAMGVHHQAHKIKGLSANFDAHPVVQLAALLEARGKQHDLTGIEVMFQKLHTQVDLLTQAIHQEIMVN